MPAIETHALTKVFRDFWGRRRLRALDALDLEVREGEIFGLLGPNGSGKSTTIKLLLGLLRPTSGEARILGGSPEDVRLKSRLGYQPEDSYLYPYLTAEETLDFYGRIFSMPRAARRRRSAEILERVGLAGAGVRAVGEFSKGMQRRLGLAQALVNDPELLVLDEPTAGLDPIGSRDVKDLLLDLRRRGKTVLLTSHLLADVESVCDRVAILRDGRLLACGEVSMLLADDERTQITTGKLSARSQERLTTLLREMEGPEVPVEIGAPSTRLEDFFLKIVGASRKEAAVTRRAEGPGESGKDRTA
jgi:ABC-2 type transport system ATP-binding protein